MDNETMEQTPIILHASTLNMDLIRLLAIRWVVIIEQKDSDVRIELYEKQT